MILKNIRRKYFINSILAVLALGLTLGMPQASADSYTESVQQLLADQGYYDGPIDGEDNDATVAAIQAFQRDHGIEADGIAGEGTYAALQGGGSGSNEGSSEESDEEGQWITVTATAYSPEDSSLNDSTATGTDVHQGIIAVDPDYIPLGTTVYIPGYGYAVAQDTGDSISGYNIDIAFDSYDEAIEFGCRTIRICIVD